MRVVAGRHKGRRLAAPPGLSVRPTSERAREALFNILVHGRLSEDGASAVAGARALDAFAGSGAVGFEALSRGAAHVTFMDADPEALEAVRRNAAHLGETGNAAVVRADPVHPPAAPAPCGLVFLDPPYGSGRAARALAVVEVAAREPFEPPEGFAILEERTYGAARLVILRRGAG